MNHVLEVAGCISSRYAQEFGEQIDEMKLHKLLYFAQRESLIQNDAPLFPETFQGWKYGPVMPEIRSHYKAGTLPTPDAELSAALAPILDRVFKDYAAKESMSLSRLTHGEECWIRSRQGISWTENSNNEIPTDDIRLDAKRMKERRTMLTNLGLL